MDYDKLIERFEKEFEEMKKGLGFKSTLAELDRIFFLKDYIATSGFVSNKLSRMVSSRLKDLFMMWYNYLHALVMPNPSSLLVMTESSFFSDEEKQGIIQLMSRITAHISENTLIGLTKDKKAEADYIDNSVKLWKEIKPSLVRIMKHARDSWLEKSKEKPEVRKT